MSVPEHELDAAWGIAAKREPRWPAVIALLLAAGLNYILPGKLLLGPSWLFPTLELAIIIPLFLSSHHKPGHHSFRRAACIALI